VIDQDKVKKSLSDARRYLLNRMDADTWPEDEEAAARIAEIITTMEVTT
jgi:hypothetical protein